MGLQTNGLSLEVVGREVSGRPVPGKPRRPAGPYLLGLPALLLSCHHWPSGRSPRWRATPWLATLSHDVL